MEKIVLIIDDDHSYLKFMQGHFRMLEGFKTEVCPTGEAGLEKLKTVEPYLIILDHHLTDPNRDGTYFLKEIRKQNYKVPIIYISGDTSAALKTKVEKLKVQGFLYKNEAFLVNLRTALDAIEEKSKKVSMFKKFFN